MPKTQPYLKPLGVGTAPEAHGSANKACELLAGQLYGDKALPLTACCAGQVCQTFRKAAPAQPEQQAQEYRAVRTCSPIVSWKTVLHRTCLLVATLRSNLLAADPG
jgi:hypothetical protein